MNQLDQSVVTGLQPRSDVVLNDGAGAAAVSEGAAQATGSAVSSIQSPPSTFGDSPLDTSGGISSSASALAGSERAGQALMLGEVVGRYQIRRLLGRGGMGEVYLARDVMLGRSVALKVVRPERLGERGGERFVEEARLLAALNHPHIVQLYDAGMHRGGPYLALEYVEGETLLRRGAAGSVDEALRLARAIAEALVHAHAAGILHCDLKPGNVLLGGDGRLRVVDFGLARRASRTGSGVEGTPQWMAPEQWRGQPLTDRVDVWALAVVFIELLGADHPFAPLDAAWSERVLDASVAPVLPARAELPARIGELLAASLEREAARRPSAADWLHALEEAIAGRDAPASAEGPYRGLSSFGETHARDFFGRELEIDAFLERLRTVTLLPIVGPSGAGKSSFLYAGVIPRLRARSAWSVISLRPGASPVESLARRLLAAGNDGGAPTLAMSEEGREGDAKEQANAVSVAFAGSTAEVQSLARELRATPSLLAVRMATLARSNGGGVLLAIDQLEELFTHGASEADVACLLAMLLQAADDPSEDVRVVVTVRDDFVGRIAGLRELFVMRALGTEELRLAISGPLRRTGCSFEEPQLIEDMLAELGGGSSAELPLLQFACRALWEGRDVERRQLLRATYEHIGGVAGALARHADGVIDGMTQAEQGIARQVFLHLVVGTARRAVPRRQLEVALESAGEAAPTPQPAGAEPVQQVIDRVLARLIGARLVVQRTSTDGNAVVEIAHEALLRSWMRLQRWLEETRDERRLLDELTEAAEIWRRRGRRAEETWPASEISAARHRLMSFGLQAPAAVEDFLATGELRHRIHQRRQRTRLAFLTVAALAVAVAAVLLAGDYRRQKLAVEAQNEALRLAGVNLGPVELVLQPFDWQDGRAIDVSAKALTALSWRVFGPVAGDPHHPGAELPPELVRRRGSVFLGLARRDAAELPGGTVFLRLDGRGRSGESCPPSWIRIQTLPGYAARQQPAIPIELAVPTCAASRAGMVHVEAGPFIYGGPGDPPTKYPRYVEPEATVVLPSFWIDRTEVSNAQFAPFAKMSGMTGYPVPDYPSTGPLVGAGAPQLPIVSIDAFEAEAFCRYLGKRLPSDHEWTKAARGGLAIAGRANSAPRRLFPWGAAMATCANTEGGVDGFPWVAPVDSLPCGASPYGVLNLAGNVAEWISREGQTTRDSSPLRVTRGGQADSPEVLEQSTTIFRNQREGRQFDFAIGMRCVE